MSKQMEKINLADVKEGETYIVESKHKSISKKVPTTLTDFEENFEYEQFQVMKILKIEEPFTVIKGARSGRELVKLKENWTYYKPSAEILKALKNHCEDEY